MSFGFNDRITNLVKGKYSSAKATGALIFSDTKLSLVNVQGALLQLRFCPTLSKKPTQQDVKRNISVNKHKIDPFENPAEELLIDKIPSPLPSHALLLNKFPIIPHHFIIATIGNKEQSHALEQEDLGVTYQCLKAWQEASHDSGSPDELFAFFNSGDHSGASQPHRHLQLLPVGDMGYGVEGKGTWSLLLDQISKTEALASSHPGTIIESPLPLPFAYYATRLPHDASGASLHRIYTDLYATAAKRVDEYIARNPQDMKLHSTETGALQISYNLGFSTKCMIICSRRREGVSIYREDGTEIDSVSLNGTILGGTLMVKNEELWHLLQHDINKLEEVLKRIGIPQPRGDEQQVADNL